jgi:hypothetical protein
MDARNVMYATHPENVATAAVYRLRIGSYVAQCSCGWSAPRRLLKAAACQDAWAHAAQWGCQLHHPLMQE